jgi:hypothetical protein
VNSRLKLQPESSRQEVLAGLVERVTFRVGAEMAGNSISNGLKSLALAPGR